MAKKISMPPEMRHRSYPQNNAQHPKDHRISLYYARAVEPTVLMPVNDIATEQTKLTEKTQASADQLMDYLATHPDATIRYHKSDMILHTHSDASYLSVSHARISLGGLFYCGYKPPNADKLNGSILKSAAVIKNVVASAEESEVRACFQNAQNGEQLRVTLTELDHQKPATPLRMDNSTLFGIINETLKQKRSKTMDMRYHWLTDRVRQKQFDVYLPILGIIIPSIIQRNIKEICAHSSYIRLTT
jgi:hypothetical protein